jgi:hypothetical protein
VKFKLLIALTVLLGGAAQAEIRFKPGWNDPENSDVQPYTEPAAKQLLRNKSDDLKKIIDGPATCVLEVTKGCHQANDPHFTVNGLKSKSGCKVKSLYVGSKSDHVISCP